MSSCGEARGRISTSPMTSAQPMGGMPLDGVAPQEKSWFTSRGQAPGRAGGARGTEERAFGRRGRGPFQEKDGYMGRAPVRDGPEQKTPMSVSWTSAQ